MGGGGHAPPQSDDAALLPRLSVRQLHNSWLGREMKMKSFLWHFETALQAAGGPDKTRQLAMPLKYPAHVCACAFLPHTHAHA